MARLEQGSPFPCRSGFGTLVPVLNPFRHLHQEFAMASTWTAPQFREFGMDCEINSYFDEFGDERSEAPRVEQPVEG